MDVFEGGAAVATADRVHDKLDLEDLVDDVKNLPETQRTALMLREMGDLSYDQIAETMDTSIPSVKSLLVRARVSLAEAAESRRLSCDEVRLELGAVAEGLQKLSSPARRHVSDCERCRAFKKELSHDQPQAHDACPGRRVRSDQGDRRHSSSSAARPPRIERRRRIGSRRYGCSRRWSARRGSRSRRRRRRRRRKRSGRRPRRRRREGRNRPRRSSDRHRWSRPGRAPRRQHFKGRPEGHRSPRPHPRLSDPATSGGASPAVAAVAPGRRARSTRPAQLARALQPVVAAPRRDPEERQHARSVKPVVEKDSTTVSLGGASGHRRSVRRKRVPRSSDRWRVRPRRPHRPPSRFSTKRPDRDLRHRPGSHHSRRGAPPPTAAPAALADRPSSSPPGLRPGLSVGGDLDRPAPLISFALALADRRERDRLGLCPAPILKV